MTPFTHFGGPRGHGSKTGTTSNVFNSGKLSTCHNDSTIKKPTLNTKGLISTKYKWNKRGYPYTVVQPDINNSFFDSSSRYTRDLAAASICVLPKDVSNVDKSCTGGNCSNFIGGKRVIRTVYSKQFNSSVSQGMYIFRRTKRCANTSLGNTTDSTYPAKINNDSTGC
jgi:hypothetical protein